MTKSVPSRNEELTLEEPALESTSELGTIVHLHKLDPSSPGTQLRVRALDGPVRQVHGSRRQAPGQFEALLRRRATEQLDLHLLGRGHVPDRTSHAGRAPSTVELFQRVAVLEHPGV